jgi:hypothetical protein
MFYIEMVYIVEMIYICVRSPAHEKTCPSP